jgi:transcriptional regulator with XRE-family HTH domain
MSSAGDLLRDARQAAGLSQRQLARRAGIRQAAVSQVESGRVDPSLSRLQGLVSLTGHHLGLPLEPQRLDIDEGLLLDNLRLFAEERLELTIKLSQYSLALADAGLRARRESIEREYAGADDDP